MEACLQCIALAPALAVVYRPSMPGCVELTLSQHGTSW